ncbi:extracellular solute-binding protein [Paenibacillus thiaminolyticus]|uniref:Extracellular solute-binding protein n=1 Tax=Paenibacillus thiaminolyticus TaxID=49283 RepID=A0AAP9J2E8_PANTH|nr:extracellular solute-binding protein [Paenibacillus thiaminolyticus]MCY9533532.1 extracellular solute-binding protein [Paenibacillus thiaminolyticus]MCY9600754.1 extracellular solute-binding protein [Paenibacillus thiaminolyticus]MCY9607582.1 extracellular solute-binding protein [Paenibacillus thiaminolyticus]MCY9611382.1 extracellular solute-binding protein [Paenibacillus thiaminolyticus]MCY9617347.1 extracellular solute-binding protein [Paenibacillus thiaminolyticus]
MTSRPSRTTFRQRLDEMVTVLRDDIITGRRAAGDYLPSEVALAEQFQLSKNSVRKGLERLVEEKLIEKVPRVGNRIADPGASGTVLLRFGYYRSVIQEAALDQLIEGFQQAHPHIRVELVPLPYENYPDAVSGYIGHDMLDVATVNYNDFRWLADEGHHDLLEPLAPRTEQYPFIADCFRHEGQLLGLPLIFSPVMLCYNRDHFLAHDLPEPDSSWRWSELMTAAERLGQEPGTFGFYFHMLSNNRWPVFLLQSGGRFELNEAGNVPVCGTKLMEGLRLTRELIDRQSAYPAYLSENDMDAERLFLQGKLSVIIATYFSLNHLMDAPFAFEVAPLPYLNEAKSLLLAIGLMVNRTSAVKEAALELVDYLLSYEAQLHIRQHTFSIPAHKKAAEWNGKEMFPRPSRFSMYREIIPSLRFFTELGLCSADLQHVCNALKLYWSRLEDEAAMCSRLEGLLSERAAR